MGTKVCYKCEEEKALEEFHNASKRKDGKQPYCKSCFSKYQRKYKLENKQRIQNRTKEYYKANRDRLLAYKQDNKKRLMEKWCEYKKERFKSDPMFAMKERCRARIRLALSGKGFSKRATTKDMLGCTWEELVQHLESQFTEGMSWENRSEWHIDHIIPLASAETEEETISLCHYTNLQPLWAKDNRKKGASHA